jgi:hypothetical protein
LHSKYNKADECYRVSKLHDIIPDHLFMDLSFINAEHLRFLFVSSKEEDLDLANDLLEQKNVHSDELDKILEELNFSHSDWHFFMKDCRIKRVWAKKPVQT